MKKPMNVVGKQIQKLRNQQGLSQPELSAKCQRLGWDMSREVLAKIENQIRKVSDYEVLVLAQGLDVPFELLYPERTKLKNSWKTFY